MLPNQDSCEECPPFSLTRGEGKTSIADCICNEGFYGDLSKDDSCTGMPFSFSPPSLQPPPHSDSDAEINDVVVSISDIDECDDGSFNCSDGCVNTPGGAHCTCLDGYELDKDGKTCIGMEYAFPMHFLLLGYTSSSSLLRGCSWLIRIPILALN